MPVSCFDHHLHASELAVVMRHPHIAMSDTANGCIRSVEERGVTCDHTSLQFSRVLMRKHESMDCTDDIEGAAEWSGLSSDTLYCILDSRS